MGDELPAARRPADIAFIDPLSGCGVASVETAELLMQGTEKAIKASAAAAVGVQGESAKCRGEQRLPLEQCAAALSG
jgi:hypothetical protein